MRNRVWNCFCLVAALLASHFLFSVAAFSQAPPLSKTSVQPTSGTG
jgi:hypothetical protein